MARPLRIEYPGAVYHVTARGNDRAPTFEDDADQVAFLVLLEEVVERFKWLCHAYVLMGNHYHLLVETIEGNLSVGMRHVNGVYTQRFNRRHHRVGHLFQGRFKSILVERQAYLLELCRYVVLNPVRAGMVENPEDYEWSSYRATAGITRGARFVCSDWILSQFSSDASQARRLYMNFVKSGIDGARVRDDLKSRRILGGEKFLEAMEPALREKRFVKEIPRCERLASRPSLKDLFEGSFGKEERNVLIRRAHLDYSYSFTDIAKHIGLHYATVSRIARGKGWVSS